jgi:predicted nucleic acid-binding protein
MKRRTFIDTDLLIDAARGDVDIGGAAMAVLSDTNRVFLTSVFVQLEIIPQARFNRRERELAFYMKFFSRCHKVAASDELVALSINIRSDIRGLGALDALHLAAAIQGGADELVTSEGRTKPMFSCSALTVTSIRP